MVQHDREDARMAMFWKDAGWCCRTHRPLSSADLTVLIHLYQPLVGAEAIALYLTLACQLPLHRAGITEIRKHSELLAQCTLGLEELLKARWYLEGVGLLSTYEKKDPEKGIYYEYELIPPLSPAKFFHSDVLSLALYHHVGKERFLQLREEMVDGRLLEPPPSGVQVTDVTKSFQEVFGSYSPIELAKRSAEERELPWPGQDVDERLHNGKVPDWDDDGLAMIKMRLSNQLDEGAWTEELVSELKEIRFLYQLDEWDLLRALQNPYVTRHGKIDVERLRSYVKSEYRLRFGGSPVIRRKPLSAEEAPEPKEAKRDGEPLTEEEKHFQQLAQMSPLELLSHYHGGMRIPDSDVELVETLVHQYGLPHGVINVLLEYVLLKYDYKLPRNLVTKIAGHWKRLGIQTVQEALAQARKENWEPRRKRAGTGRTKAVREEKLPRAVEKQLQSENGAASDKSKPESTEDLADKQARIRAKLRLMNERLLADRQEREGP
jgi:replication initiation and membrane attachment protein